MAGVGELSNLQILEIREGYTSDIKRAEGNEVVLNHQQSQFTQYYHTLLFNVPMIDPETMYKDILGNIRYRAPVSCSRFQ